MAKKQPAQADRVFILSARQRIKLLDSITAAPDTPDKERRRLYEAWLLNSTGNIVGGANPFAELAREYARRLRNLTPKKLAGEIARERQRLEYLDAARPRLKGPREAATGRTKLRESREKILREEVRRLKADGKTNAEAAHDILNRQAALAISPPYKLSTLGKRVESVAASIAREKKKSPQ